MHSFQEDLVLVSGMGQTPHWASSTGDLAGAYIPTNPMADPVSLAWTFLLSVTPSTLALLLTASLSSPQTTLLLPLHTAPVPLLHVTSAARDGRRRPGTQVPGTALLVTPPDGGAGVAQGRSDLRLGTSSLLKVQYFGHLMQRAESLMLGKTEGRRRRGRQWMR